MSEFNPVPSMPQEPPVPQSGGKKKIWVIVLIILLVLCCCCVVVLGAGYQFGDQIFKGLNLGDIGLLQLAFV